jgi:hypothetical protein
MFSRLLHRRANTFRLHRTITTSSGLSKNKIGGLVAGIVFFSLGYAAHGYLQGRTTTLSTITTKTWRDVDYGSHSNIRRAIEALKTALPDGAVITVRSSVLTLYLYLSS